MVAGVVDLAGKGTAAVPGSCNRLISFWKWSRILELVPFLAQKGSLLLMLLPVKIHGAQRDLMVATRFFPLYSEE